MDQSLIVKSKKLLAALQNRKMKKVKQRKRNFIFHFCLFAESVRTAVVRNVPQNKKEKEKKMLHLFRTFKYLNTAISELGRTTTGGYIIYNV